MFNLYEQLRILAEGDLREYARDSLVGIHPDQGELRDWADLMDRAADEIKALREALRFYANDENYQLRGALNPECPYFIGPNIARTALREPDPA